MAITTNSHKQLHRTLSNHPLGAGLDCYFLFERAGIKWQLVKEDNGNWRLVLLRGSGPNLHLAFEQVMELEQAREYAAGYGVDLKPGQGELEL
ncbi:hypothetical protein LCGC14_2359930 [marine sediment metagenome]|uniref:Uncharacterized protein n=1 Tax=marine sediment metagenome TaxID=412755 RepID=A0A0F9F1R7_9ZZZZ